MKIGILSYWDTQHNYGQVLQCFALQEFLRKQGHTPYHIKYIPGQNSTWQKVKKLVVGALSGQLKMILEQRRKSHDPGYQQHIARIEQDCRRHPRNFDDFRTRYIALSDKVYTLADLKAAPPEADCFIAGSDQIWGAPDGGFLLDFGSDRQRRIAYAPSTGGMEISRGYFRSYFKKCLRRMDLVTAREHDGVEHCRKLGRTDARIVPDPVFLLSADDYRRISRTPHLSGKPYILLYLLGNKIDTSVEEIHRWAAAKGYDVKYITAQGRFDDYTKLYPNVDEWLGLIDHASLVMTNSFHGMVVSCILNKPFLVFELSGSYTRMNGRITTTLSHLGLESRIYGSSLDEILKPIDFAAANAVMKADRSEIKKLLTASL